MVMKTCVTYLCAGTALFFTLISGAQAQATRTWVSGVGDDANPCSRTAPCKTYAGAISKTAAGGEISTLDPGGFGGLTITKAITINGDGTLAGILVGGTNGIIVNAGVNDVVRLRNLSINGVSAALDGIRFLAGKMLEIDKVTIAGFTSDGIEVNGGSNLLIKDSSITNITNNDPSTGNGVNIQGSAAVSATLENVLIEKTNTAVNSNNSLAVTMVRNSVLSTNSAFGAHASAGNIGLSNSTLINNGVAAQAETGTTMWLIDNDLFKNTTTFGCGAGTLRTNSNNHVGGNNSPGCAPATQVNLY